MNKMQVEEIKKKIQLAIKAVADVEEPFRNKAFEVVLSRLLEEPEVKGRPSPVPMTLKGAKTLNEKIARFAKKVNLDVDKLKDIFEFKEDKPVFIAKVEGTDGEKQGKASQCLLIVFDEIYEKDWLETSILRQMLDDYGIPLANLARNLTNQKEIFRKMGQKQATKYKLTGLGKKKASELIRELAI
jgi:uncharacterized protein with NAD-binding domain and iron-sulfur cluster